MKKIARGYLARAAVLTLACAALASGLPAASAPTGSGLASVPYVGCASDGQLGPQPSPKRSKPTPRLPPSVASRLAYYAAVNNGVLAPRGWYCFSLYGSSGTIVLVAPQPIDVKNIYKPNFKLAGDGIEFAYTLGGTSGRFEVAKVAAKFFPIARDLVDRVAKEEKEVGLPFDLSGNAFRDDRILSRTDKIVRFVTPEKKQGLGTSGRLAPNESPIEGMTALIIDGGETDLIELNVRLPQKSQDLTPTIQSVAETNHGDPLSNTPLRNPAR